MGSTVVCQQELHTLIVLTYLVHIGGNDICRLSFLFYIQFLIMTPMALIILEIYPNFRLIYFFKLQLVTMMIVGAK